MGIFIPHADLDNLKKYKYQSDDRSIITKYVLKPFWQKFVNIFPLWLAPNVVTLSGFGFVLVNLMMVLYIDPTLSQDSPSWCYISYALGIFLYQTFDACDGIQARRTGQSGPLGELFDHCVDAMNTSLSVLIFASVFQLGWGWYLFLSQFGTLCNFYLSTWEEYYTHVLYLSVFSGPVEGILMVIGAFIATAYYGPQLWSKQIFELDLSSIGFSQSTPIRSTDLFIIWGTLGLYFNISTAKANVDKAIPKSEQAKALKGLVPFALFYTSVFAELFLYPETLTTYGAPFFLTIACTVAFAVGRIIIGHLTLQKFPYINPPMFIPLAEIVLINVLTYLGYTRETVIGPILYAGFGLSVGIYGMFVTEIIYEITTYLDIYALSIKHPKLGKSL